MKNSYNKYAYYIVIGLFTLIIFYLKFGWRVLDTGHIGWLYSKGSDMLPDAATWEYYRYSKNNLPPGQMQGYAWPQIVGIGNTNIIPWIAFPLHWLSDYLPYPFQYFGLFYLLCYVLQAFYADKLLKILKVNSYIYRFIGVAFLVISSSLLDRYAHIALCAHFLILAALCTYFVNKSSSTKLIQICVISFFAALTHPYLILFPLSIGAAIFWKPWKEKVIRVSTFLCYNILNIATVVFSFWISGVFSLPMGVSQSSGFGYYSAATTTFFNSFERTNASWLNFRTYYDGQLEGYAYLGLGCLLLWLILLGNKKFYQELKPMLKRHRFLLIIVILMTVFAFAFQITFANFRLAIPLQEHTFVYKIFAIFRSSGRYIWLAHQLLLAVPIIIFYRLKLFKTKLNYTLLALLLGIQIWDLEKPIQFGSFDNHYTPDEGFVEIKSVLKNVDGVIYTFPAYNRGMVSIDDELYFLSALAPLQKRITGGHLPRPNFQIQDSIKGFQEKMINEAQWLVDTQDVILLSAEQLYNFAPMLTKDSNLVAKTAGKYSLVFNRYNIPVANAATQLSNADINSIYLLDYLREQMKNDNWLLLSAKDEASFKLDDNFKSYFKSSRLSGLSYRNAYVGIWKGHMPILEKHLEGLIEVDTIINNVNFRISSISGIDRNEEKIMVNGNSVSPNGRGLNIVVLDKNMNIVDARNFDTHRTMYSKK